MKFKITKRYSLAHLGEEWAECYLDFTPFTMREVNDEFGPFAKLDQNNPQEVLDSSKKVIELLKAKYVGGTGIAANGQTVEIKKSDLTELPAEVLGGVISFLSSNLTAPKKQPSVQS